ncbi:possible restriction /modification enzyme [Sulfuriferula multivorans]|uniref:site-specific DNA-methyltransferase (adenine-specific) n=1 Tax=Sulfuriferula multivorans TaxID=1559896 RepID=A0A401JBT0_9PROT|nr:N-6 DNA methylase [Sulfuriferula multivorans]GBL45067.1 possible restriction /modification enzyme [Sulfuriferula multivorans]
MARRSTTQLGYQAIRIEGGLIPADELARLTSLQTPDKTEQTENHYSIPRGLKLRDEVARYWKIAQNLWTDFQTQRQRTDINAHNLTLREFLLPLLRSVLGFTDLEESARIHASGHTYNIDHLSGGGRVPLILAAHNQGLDVPDDRFGETNPETGKVRRRSPFMLAQEALNASDDALWAVVSNGLRLRILRDNPSLTRPVYVEIDLEAIFTEELYADFVAFWLLAHASRFAGASSAQGGSGAGAPFDPADCAWERWRNAGQEAGVRARDRLRDGVAEALRALGTGFLSHRDNNALRQALQQENGLSKQAFFEELLRLVYRLIFLATVEDRTEGATGLPLIFTPNSPKDVQQRYLAGYSLTWLRERAARRSGFDTHSDLWQALSITFDALGRGEPALALPALGGLFDADQCAHLGAAQIENRWLLAAIFQLGYFREPTGLTRVNYRDMGPEELGSVYESLLELVPDLQNLTQAHAARLAFVGDDDTTASTRGNTRKLTGSYYTPDPLVQELIQSALEPVIAGTLRANPQRPVEALLDITICDPACGSGHFLLAAARRLADEVAKLRAPSGAPSQADYRHALRDVVSHCIFGVDKNPMAIALAKTALWLEAYTPDMPLSFLDHHLQVGDALLGVLDPKVLENGIPDEAYAALSGDDKATASALKKQNKADLKSWQAITAGDLFTKTDLATQADAVEHLADDSLAGIEAKRAAWAQAADQARHSILAHLADTYVAAFLAPKLPQDAPHIPLSGYLWGIINGGQSKPEVDNAAQELCRAHGVFHWWLAFPQVRARGGFSVMLGNPPWERIKLQEEEFFAARSPLVAMAKNKAERGQRIEWLQQGLLLHTLFPDVEAAEGLSPPNRAEMRLHEEFISARRGAEAASLYAHDSGRYPLTGVGDVNTYALFAESFFQLVAPTGRTGFIVQSGLGTDDSTKHFFQAISQTGRLASFFGFDNAKRIFPAVHPDTPFALVTLGPKAEAAQLVHYALSVEHLGDQHRRFTLTPDEFRLINPNTRTCPVFRSQRDAELTKKLYRAAPVLIEEGETDKNPWGIRFMRMLDMSNDSGLFRDEPAAPGEAPRLPLYEAKMIHQFDHRWATYVAAPARPDGLDTEDCTDAQKAEPDFVVRPRYWVDEREVLARIARVPARVANAWLGMHIASPSDQAEDEQKLQFAIAAWVAGELFRRAAGAPEEGDDWSSRQRLQGLKIAEAGLVQRFPALAQALKAADISGKKALIEFGKWALQDDEVGLNDAELATLAQAIAEPAALLVLLDTWMDARSRRWLMGFRGITNATNERSFIATAVPRIAAGNSLPILISTRNARSWAALIGNLGTLVLDFVARQKIGGTNLNFFIVKQFPVFPPDRYTEADLAYIVPRVLELTYTAHNLKPWADDLAAYDPRPADQRVTPFAWNPERRAQIRAELDAWYARLYSITRDELRYILDPADVMGEDYPSETFRVLKNSEMREFGEYRTRRLVLEAWDRLESGELVPTVLPDHGVLVVYSELAVIRNESEAELAGLVAALVAQCGVGISVAELQEMVASATRTGYPELLLESKQAERLQSLVGSMTALTSPEALALIPQFVERLEASGSVRRERKGETTLFRPGVNPIPADVRMSPVQTELADLILALDAQRRRAQSADMSSNEQGERDSGVG